MGFYGAGDTACSSRNPLSCCPGETALSTGQEATAAGPCSLLEYGGPFFVHNGSCLPCLSGLGAAGAMMSHPLL